MVGTADDISVARSVYMNTFNVNPNAGINYIIIINLHRSISLLANLC